MCKISLHFYDLFFPQSRILSSYSEAINSVNVCSNSKLNKTVE